jgi:hypothetical protein
MGVGLIIGFINHLHVVTTNNYYYILYFHTTNHFTLRLLYSISTSHYLVTAVHNGYSSVMSSLEVFW